MLCFFGCCSPCSCRITFLPPGFRFSINLRANLRKRIFIASIQKSVQRRIVCIRILFQPIACLIFAGLSFCHADSDFRTGKPSITNIIRRYRLCHENLCFSVDFIKNLIRNIHFLPVSVDVNILHIRCGIMPQVSIMGNFFSFPHGKKIFIFRICDGFLFAVLQRLFFPSFIPVQRWIRILIPCFCFFIKRFRNFSHRICIFAL